MEIRNKQMIYLVSKDQNISKVLSQSLCPWYSVRHGKENIAGAMPCREEIEGIAPDLIIVNVDNPGTFPIIDFLKSTHQLKDIPVMAVSEREDNGDDAYLLDLGCIDVVHRPLNLPVIMARIRNVLLIKIKIDILESLCNLKSNYDSKLCVYNASKIRTEFHDLMVKPFQFSSIAALDIDHFKSFNDTYGHLAGDSCLQQIAHRIKKMAIASGFQFGRWGGEEFCVLIPNCSPSEAASIANSIRESVYDLKIPNERSSVCEFVTISIGLVTFTPEKELSFDSLFSVADEQLYLAKEAGRNQVCGKSLVSH